MVILAGYKDKMDSFFAPNPGMGSRIAHHIHFPDYSVDELVGIACLILEEQGTPSPRKPRPPSGTTSSGA